jgi:hypothetical protein
VGEVERIRPSQGASFGHDLGQRVVSLGDRAAKKHQDDDADPSKGDAVELHEELESEPTVQPIHFIVESSDHLDLSA